MKKILLILCLALTVPAFTGCQTAPATQKAEVQTLLMVGQSAEATVKLAAHLYQAGTITAVQAKAVADFYTYKFQPAYGLAVAAVQANKDDAAPQELINLATQISALLLQYRNHTP